jgi:hypothetical protein
LGSLLGSHTAPHVGRRRGSILHKAGEAMRYLVLRGACILALIALSLPAYSQVQNGEFTSLITDRSDAVVRGARVLI